MNNQESIELPQFKYHPDPVSNKIIVECDFTCSVCNLRRGFVYEGPYYCLEDVENICPWCIKDGSAASKLNVEFAVFKDLNENLDSQKIDELIHRTPGYFYTQEGEWAIHCNDFCAYIEKTKWSRVEELIEDLRFDLEEMQTKLELSDDIFYEDLRMTNSPLWLQLFKCLPCGKYMVIGNYE